VIVHWFVVCDCKLVDDYFEMNLRNDDEVRWRREVSAGSGGDVERQ